MVKKTKKSVASKPKKTSVKTSKLSQTKKLKVKKLTAEELEEKYWNEVDQLAQEKIYHLFTTNIPFQNIKLITEFWRYEDRQQKLSGLFLHRDVDYRTLLLELENEWYERVEEEKEELPSKEILAEEVALWYCRLVMKALITDLSDYSSYDPSLFSDLTSD